MWTPKQDPGNPFYTNFMYSRVTGIGKDESEMSVSRRDPSKVLKIGDTYYVWYTAPHHRAYACGECATTTQADEEIPAVDWDLADICYATSKDGFHWEEQGIAVPRAPKGTYGDRSLSTPDILVWQERYYLYYQCFTTMWRAHDCVGVSMAHSDSPDGPWSRMDKPIVPQGVPGEWDSCAIHDPYPLVYKGQVWLYYKGSPTEKVSGRFAARARRCHRRPARGSLCQIAAKPRHQTAGMKRCTGPGRTESPRCSFWTGRKRTRFNSRRTA